MIATKKVTLVLLASLLAGCASTVPDSTASATDKVPDNTATADSYATPTPTTETSSANTIEHGIYKFTVPDGWTAKKDVITVNCSGETPDVVDIITFYKGDIDDSNPHLVVGSLEAIGIGGDWNPEKDYGYQTIGDFEYWVEYNGYPFTVYKSEYEEKTYDYAMTGPDEFETFGQITFSYYDKGQGNWDDEDVLSIIGSMQIDTVGKVTIDVDNLNVRYQPSLNADKIGTLINGEEYNVYEIQNDGTYDWYRIGDYSWIADTNNEWVTFKKD